MLDFAQKIGRLVDYPSAVCPAIDSFSNVSLAGPIKRSYHSCWFEPKKQKHLYSWLVNVFVFQCAKDSEKFSFLCWFTVLVLRTGFLFRFILRLSWRWPGGQTTETFATEMLRTYVVHIFPQAFNKHKSLNAQFRTGKGNCEMMSPCKTFNIATL